MDQLTEKLHVDGRPRMMANIGGTTREHVVSNALMKNQNVPHWILRKQEDELIRDMMLNLRRKRRRIVMDNEIEKKLDWETRMRLTNMNESTQFCLANLQKDLEDINDSIQYSTERLAGWGKELHEFLEKKEKIESAIKSFENMPKIMEAVNGC